MQASGIFLKCVRQLRRTILHRLLDGDEQILRWTKNGSLIVYQLATFFVFVWLISSSKRLSGPGLGRQYWNRRRVTAVHWGEKTFIPILGKHRLQVGQWVPRSRVWSGLDSAMMAAIESFSPGRSIGVSVTSWCTCSSNYQQSRYVDQSLIDLSRFHLEKAELKGREKGWKNFMEWGDFVESFLNGLTKERRNKMGKRLMRGKWGQRGRESM